MTQFVVSANPGPEGRQEIARSVSAGKLTIPREYERSEGPPQSGSGVVCAKNHPIRKDHRRNRLPTPSASTPDRRCIRSTLRFCSTIAALLLAAVASAQQPPADKESPTITASLLLIKADWSQAPAAKEIEADLRKTLSGEPVTKDDLEKLPASGPRILFPISAASIYSQQHYSQLLAWLKANQLVIQVEPFANNKVEPQPGVPGGAVPGWYASTLSKSYEFFGLQAPRTLNDLFFTQTTEFRWTVSERKVQRELDHYEKARGQQEIQPVDRRSFDRCEFTFNPLEDGQVMIAHAFPDIINDREFRTASNDKGFQALIVIERKPSSPAAAAEPRLLLPDKVERIKAERMRGRSSGTGLFLPQPALAPASEIAAGTPSSRYIISKNVMISWSEAKDVAWGFSISLGKWAEQKLDPPATNTPPIVGEDIAVWRVGSAYYGFSGEAGRWDVLRLSEGRTPPPVVDTGFVRVHDGDDVYTFSGSTGRWSSPKGSDAGAESQPDKWAIKVFPLRHARAVDAQRVVRQVLGERFSLAADERTNSLIVNAFPEDIKDVEALVNVLDQPSPARAAPLGSIMPGTTGTESNNGMFGSVSLPPGESGEGGMFGGGAMPLPPSAADLKSQYDRHAQQASEVAKQIRDLQSTTQAHKPAIDELAAKLRRAVAAAFTARQQLHQAEAAQLQQRIAGIQQNLQTRQKLSDQIIDHRVKDLLNPDLQWESTSRLPGGTLATGPGAASTPSTARPKVAIGPSWGPESEQILQELGIQVQKLTPDDAPEPNLSKSAEELLWKLV